MVGIKLKEFQEKCVEELLEQTVFGEKKEILLQAPTGSGKTIMLLEYIDRFLLENKDLGSSLYCYFNINIWYYIFSNTLNLYLPTKI